MAMHRSAPVMVIAAAILVAAGLACNAASSFTEAATATARPRPTRTATPAEEPTEKPTPQPSPTAEPTPTPEPTEAPEPIPVDLFEDDFSDSTSGWSEVESEAAQRAYRDGEYVFEIFKTKWFVWSNPDAGGLSNTHTTVTVSSVGEALDPSFGIICNYQDDGAFYFLGAAPDGFYAIARVEGNDYFFLTSDENLWVRSNRIDLNADAYVLEAICAADGTLTLIVDGEEIASVQDSTYTAGDIGLFGQSFDQVPVEIHFDDLTVKALEE